MGLMKRFLREPGQRRNTLSVTRLFFDRRTVTNAMDAATHKAMSIGAARIRRRAQRSMKTVSDQPARSDSLGGHTASRPWHPPVSVRQHPWLKRFLLYYYDRASKTAIVGPVGFAAGSGAPHTLEFGGRAKIRNRRRRIRRIGDGGGIRVGGPISRTTRAVQDSRGRFTGRMVTYARLRTAEEVRRANDINAQLYGSEYVQRTIIPRPYMEPALAAETPALAGLWSNSVKA